MQARRLSTLPPTLRDLLRQPHGQTTVHGWIKSVRAHKNVAFAEIDDGSGSSVQAVFKDGKGDALTLGTAVRLRGALEPSRGRGQAVELRVDEIDVLGTCDPDAYPIQKKALPPAVLREHAHLRFRTTQTAALMRVRDASMRDWHDWFEAHGFTHIHTPILTSSDCEGAGETFSLPQAADDPFFPRPVNLTVSSQLHLEPAALALARAYTLSPCFRAERSQTSRHLAEFYMLEAELAFVDTLGALLDIVEAGFRGVLAAAGAGAVGPAHTRGARLRADLGRLGAPTDWGWLEHGFARITYTDAVAVLQRQHAAVPFEHAPRWGDGLSTEHEKWLAGAHFARPVFVTDYPAALKPFYMLPSPPAASPAPASPSAGPTVACFDLLFPGIGEMAGGSLREHRLDALVARLQQDGMSEHEYAWYLDTRRFGSAPHGGWGMGWERWLCWLTGTANVRDVVAYPRWAGSCRY
ncbi:hypothetical protein Q5752_004755 [Cryptotrichosporon argae]